MKRIFGYGFLAILVIIFLWVANFYFKPFEKLRLKFSLGDEASYLEENGIGFRDLNKNGRLDVYENTSASSNNRVNDLLAQMTLSEKVGQMFHPPVVLKGDLLFTVFASAMGGGKSTAALILDKNISHFNFYGSPDPVFLAEKLNSLQKVAEKMSLGIPLTISSDPLHEISRGGGIASFTFDAFSKWPSQLGLAASRDPGLVREFGEVASAEYKAVGIRTALHPMSDLATEPRWSRNFGTFGSNAELSADLTESYMLGFQGETIDQDSVLTMVKHFPGGGPQESGLDAHLFSGKNQIYPGNNFDYHLIPFIRAIEKGVRVIMPYYGIPVDQTEENVAMGFNKYILTDLLRTQLGFQGVICTDWGIISGRHWGVGNLSVRERYKKSVDAGVDQYGGEIGTESVIDLVLSGEISEQRIDQSVYRILLNKFDLGLFDNPYVDIDKVRESVNKKEYIEKGLEAQHKSVVLLSNKVVKGSPALPLEEGKKIYVDGFNPKVASQYGILVKTPNDADYILMNIGTVRNGNQAPGNDGWMDKLLSLNFPNTNLNLNTEIMKKIREYSKNNNVITVVDLNRPTILEEVKDLSSGLIGSFGVFDEVLLNVIFGNYNPSGKLPFEIPSSMVEVNLQKEDLPDDTKNPTFRFGFGLSYEL